MKLYALALAGILALTPTTTNARGFGGYSIQDAVDSAWDKACTIKYTQDEKEDYWQTPEETQRRGKGDCEDIAFYLYDELKKRGILSTVHIGNVKGSTETGLHVWTSYTKNGKEILLDSTVPIRGTREEIYKRRGWIYVESRDDKKYIDEFLKELYPQK